MKTKVIGIAIIAILIAVSVYFNWQMRSELSEQRKQMEQQVVLFTLSQINPNSTLEGLTIVDKVYIAQVNIPEGSSHLYVFIGQRWFDLGEGTIK